MDVVPTFDSFGVGVHQLLVQVSASLLHLLLLETQLSALSALVANLLHLNLLLNHFLMNTLRVLGLLSSEVFGLLEVSLEISNLSLGLEVGFFLATEFVLNLLRSFDVLVSFNQNVFVVVFEKY